MNSIDTVFDRNKFNSNEIARELYDPRKLGIFVINDFLDKDFCLDLYKQVKDNKVVFRRAPEVEGTSRQQLDVFYYEDTPLKEEDPFLLVRELREEYSILCKWFGRVGNFRQPSLLNSIGIHHYEQGSCGMGVHRDYSDDINLISSFVIKGNAPFYGYSDKQCNGEVKFDAPTGSLILMRAPRNERENDIRPYHAVGACEDERLTVLFRQKKSTSFLNA